MSANVPAGIRRSVRERFSNCYAYCLTSEHLTATHFEIENIDPRTAGGITEFANLCLACPMCNRFKSDLVSAVDPATWTTVPLFNAQRQFWSEHFAWSSDGDEIAGLTATGRATIGLLKMNRAAMARIRRLWVAAGEHPPRV